MIELSPTAARPAPSEAELARARRDFFLRGRPPSVSLGRQVLGSWTRCVQRGLVAERACPVEPLTAAALTEARERAELLRRLAEPELEFLAETLADTASQVILANAYGLILETRGDTRAMDRATRVALLPGVSWAEAAMGTNAIGTALTDNELTEIWGSEHFHDQHHRLCCTAVPILDHAGRPVGLLDVSGDARLPRGYARSIVMRAAREIEHRWLLNAPEQLARLRFHPARACVGAYQEGVLLLDEDRIVGANRSALQWLDTDWSLVGRRVDEVFDHAEVSAERLRTHGGRQLFGQLQAPRRVQIDPPAPAEESSLWLGEAQRSALARLRRAIDAGLATVLLGETGCGKEALARRAHALSARASGPFVAINCAALPETLIEAELFGYVEGAFTGARRRGSPGRIAEADGGILFLDEIGDMPLPLQSRLLRVLQEHRVEPLGGGAPRTVDCVVLCATHCDLDAMVAEGRFRADLLYRLQEHRVELPPWRSLPEAQRRDALALLWRQSGGPARGMVLSAAALECLLAHPWPGNFRQCAAALRALAALADDGAKIGPADLPAELRPAPAPPRVSLDELGRGAIVAALARHGGKVAPAATELGIHRATLYRQMRRLGIAAREPGATAQAVRKGNAGA
ncbi:sigma-54-dependent Fis family transcriptional regulator [Pseudothauera rhizosphaerae]|uniref:Sigma-54-dependent Fis family transcriptional regulator n=1 Tax=Pseudothauera rhizosphaerae TaxID=2565932 RepID=A0A4S4AU15_9RHOO|nr:sigma-54-dependent Fis family transcriptional regulator [Pseudothauera rhizosphaerae]THF63429.1 sigma-54-dependent Fis family transcriptional regulator [Pseudothauera rhizosphaerae]